MIAADNEDSGIELHSSRSSASAYAALPSLTPTSSASNIFAASPPPSSRAAASPSAVSGADTIVRLKNVHKTYLLGVEGVPALRGVSLDIQRGEFIVILGKSGSGKTSMLNLLGTIDKPTKGDISLCGTNINSKTKDDALAYLRLKKIGFVFQTFNLISSMTAVENVALPMVLEGSLDAAEIHRRAVMLLERVGMGRRCEHTPSQLSGGEQQRTTIARAVANQPDVLLLDEPTGDLDTKNGEMIMKMLLDLNRDENITLVMVTHDTQLKYFASRVVHMIDGKIQRVESIAASVRANAYAELSKKVAEHEESKSADGSFSVFDSAAASLSSSLAALPTPAPLDISALAGAPASSLYSVALSRGTGSASTSDAASSASASGGPTALTDVREPRTHYAFHRFADRLAATSSNSNSVMTM